jgi:hypothetical protein
MSVLEISFSSWYTCEQLLMLIPVCVCVRAGKSYENYNDNQSTDVYFDMINFNSLY